MYYINIQWFIIRFTPTSKSTFSFFRTLSPICRVSFHPEDRLAEYRSDASSGGTFSEI